MGQSSWDSLPAPTSTMKMFVVLALAAAAVAEPEAAADAQFISAYGAYGAYPYTTTYGAPSYTRSYGVYGGAYSSPLMSALSFSHIGKREAEADPALVYGNAYPYTTTYAAAAYPYSHVATPLVRNVATPLVRNVAAPLVRTVTTPFVNTVASPYVNTVASHVVPAVASHTLTRYNNPNHYTAVSNGVYGPKYVAKNGPVQHVVKREAEADPALIYSHAAPLASTYTVAPPLTPTYNHVAHVAPMTTYSHVAPMTTYSHVAPMTTTYNNIIASPVTYTAHVATPLASNGAHAVAATTAGWTHSANVGVCTNVHGQQVAC